MLRLGVSGFTIIFVNCELFHECAYTCKLLLTVELARKLARVTRYWTPGFIVAIWADPAGLQIPLKALFVYRHWPAWQMLTSIYITRSKRSFSSLTKSFPWFIQLFIAVKPNIRKDVDSIVDSIEYKWYNKEIILYFIRKVSYVTYL